MTANLPPTYHVAEAKYKAATDPAEKLSLLHELWTILPKHKGTDKMQADLKARMAKLRRTPGARAGGVRRPEFTVERSGAGQFFLIGPPNAGRSSILSALSSADPEISEGQFTTRKPVPGMMRVDDVGLQLIEAPAIYPGMTPKWLAPTLRVVDGLVLVFGLGSDELLEGFDEVMSTLKAAKIVPYTPGDDAPMPEDPGLEPMPCFVLLNQADLDPDEELSALFHEYVEETLAGLPVLRVSATSGEGLKAFGQAVWTSLDLIRIYTKLPGKPPDLKKPFVVPREATVIDLCGRIHKDLIPRFEFARLWRGERYTGARVSADFELKDKDILEIHA